MMRSFVCQLHGKFATRLSSTAKFVIPDIPYGYGDLEPFISGEIMQLHHDKHHRAYVAGLNTAYEQLAEAQHKKDVTRMIELEKLIRFHGGGHVNHSIFWGNLRPQKEGGGVLDDGELSAMIAKSYSGQEGLQHIMSTAALGVQGSGWSWLGYDPVNKGLRVAVTKNQDPLEATTGLIPLLGIDVWEHAYYPQYKNACGEYLRNIWRVVNWEDVALRLEEALKSHP